MKRVTGIGGILFKAKDPVALRAWYQTHLGIDVQEWGGAAFTWADESGNPVKGTTVWSVGPNDGDSFAVVHGWLRVRTPRVGSPGRVRRLLRVVHGSFSFHDVGSAPRKAHA
jgi:hypothetical protein